MNEKVASGVIVGHSNMDLDCLGSIALARYLFPGYATLQSRHIHPTARNLVIMYRIHLGLVTAKDFKGKAVDHLVVMDTRSRDRVREYLDLFDGDPGRIDVYDHHPSDSRDIPGATFHDCTYGANATFIGTFLMEQGIKVSPDDATIALTGIFADTGNFTHGNATAEDFEVASYLMSCGASLKLVKTFLSPLREKVQITMFHEVLNDLVFRDIRGHSILLSYTELDSPKQGLSAVVEKIFEVENPDAYFAVFSIKDKRRVLIVARSQKDDIDLNSVIASFGGGGHKKAASATVKEAEGEEVYQNLLKLLDSTLKPAISAADIMTSDVTIISPDMSLLDAAIFLEGINHTGCPVVEEGKGLVGFVTLRDIMKGRRANQMHAPVKGYMSRKVITAEKGTTFREMEDLLLTHNIGHLPILEDEKIVGIVTRTDYLAFRKAEIDKAEAIKDSLL